MAAKLKLFIAVALCAGFTLGLTVPAWAGWDEAAAAHKRGDYATAIRELRPLAEQGDGDAQFNLGIMYDVGLGVRHDYAEALQWYRKAAEQGHAKAQFNLSCTPPAKAPPRTTPKPICGITLPPPNHPPARSAMTRSSIAISLPRR